MVDAEVRRIRYGGQVDVDGGQVWRERPSVRGELKLSERANLGHACIGYHDIDGAELRLCSREERNLVVPGCYVAATGEGLPARFT